MVVFCYPREQRVNVTLQFQLQNAEYGVESKERNSAEKAWQNTFWLTRVCC